MTKHVAITILLTLLASACSIEPYQTEPTDQTNEPNQPNQPNQPDRNEPNNGTPGAPCETQVEPKRCPEVSACDDVAADCVVTYDKLCGGVAQGRFVCGAVSGTFFSDGKEFVAPSGTSWASGSIPAYCAKVAAE